MVIFEMGQFFKKCDFDLCQNLTNKFFMTSKYGKIYVCDDCLKILKKKLRIGESNGKGKEN